MRKILLLIITALVFTQAEAQKVIENLHTDSASGGIESKKVYDITLSEDAKKRLPDALHGEWYNINNSHLEYAFYHDHVIYKNRVWKYEDANIKNNNGTISIKDGTQKHSIHLTKVAGNHFKIGDYTYSRDVASCKKIISNEEYVLPILKLDTAIYIGYIKNYNERTGIKTLSIYISDIITGRGNKLIARIDADGFFGVKVPLYHPEVIFVESSFYDRGILLEPGKELFHIIKNKQSFFMGDVAAINNDLQLLGTKSAFDYDTMQKVIVDMNPYQYKTYLGQLQQKDNYRLDSIYKSGTINKKAYQIQKMEVTYEYANQIMEYKSDYTNAYKEKNKLQPKDKVKTDRIPASYYTFLNNKMVNNELAVIASSCNTFINRIKFLGLLWDNQFSISVGDMIKYMDERGYQYTAEEKQMLDSINYIETDTALSKNFYERRGIFVKSFFDNHSAISLFISSNYFNNYRINILDSVLGIDNGFATDIMYAQDVLNPIVKQLSPVSNGTLKNIQNKIKNPFIAKYIGICNDQTIAKTETNKNKGGYFVNSTPNAEADEIFDSIMAKYKGKVVYVDFWATWCGPCIAGIREIQPIKETLKDKNVVFIYITDESSPLQTWNKMIPTIKGEHYRLKPDKWNYLAAKFNISGIPHYVLVDTNGKVLNPNLPYMENSTLQNLLEKYMK